MSAPENLDGKEEMLQKLNHIIAPDASVIAAYLFGSFSSGRADKNSDIDIAVYVDEKLSIEEMGRMKLDFTTAIRQEFKRDADVVILNMAPPLLKQQIFNKGSEILCRDHEKMVEYRVRTCFEYFTYRNVADTIFHVQKQKIRRRVTDG